MLMELDNYRTGEWNSLPDDVDKHPEKVWDFSDPQFLR